MTTPPYAIAGARLAGGVGAERVAYWSNPGRPLTHSERRCADMLDWWADGIYHIEHQMRRATWHGWGVEFCTATELGTYDANELTRLVVGAHDFGIRVAITGAAPRYIRILLSPRDLLEQSVWYRSHPTLDGAIARMKRATLEQTVEVDLVNGSRCR